MAVGTVRVALCPGQRSDPETPIIIITSVIKLFPRIINIYYTSSLGGEKKRKNTYIYHKGLMTFPAEGRPGQGRAGAVVIVGSEKTFGFAFPC